MSDQSMFDQAIQSLGDGVAGWDELPDQSVSGHRFDIDALHEIFHEQTKYHRATALGHARRIQAHMTEPSLVERSVSGRHLPDSRHVLPLPSPSAIKMDITKALSQRQSARRETLSGPLDAQDLSAILHHGARIHRKGVPSATPHLVQHYRPYPSAGALYPCEIYLAIADVNGVPGGVYRYDALDHTLIELGQGRRAGFRQAETDPGQECDVSCAIIITGVFERSVRKYDLRGYRFALLEAGHILQNLSLLSAALGMPALVSASFYEAELEALIGVDGVSEAVLTSFLIGAGDLSD